ncbi:MAG: hypothetical protein RR988_01955 [Clostridia bacterium]
MKKGITKVALVIVLVVVCISVSVLAISFVFNNPIARKLDKSEINKVEQYQRELDVKILSISVKDEKFNKNTVTAITKDKIKKYIPSFKQEDFGVYEIVNSKVVKVPK